MRVYTEEDMIRVSREAFAAAYRMGYNGCLLAVDAMVSSTGCSLEECYEYAKAHREEIFAKADEGLEEGAKLAMEKFTVHTEAPQLTFAADPVRNEMHVEKSPEKKDEIKGLCDKHGFTTFIRADGTGRYEPCPICERDCLRRETSNLKHDLVMRQRKIDNYELSMKLCVGSYCASGENFWNMIHRVNNKVAELQAQVDRLEIEGRGFPIMGGPSIPWAMIAPHEAQARKNHDQTLERLAQRGGLSPAEALCVMDGTSLRGKSCTGLFGREDLDAKALPELQCRVSAYEASSGRVVKERDDLREKVEQLRKRDNKVAVLTGMLCVAIGHSNAKEGKMLLSQIVDLLSEGKQEWIESLDPKPEPSIDLGTSDPEIRCPGDQELCTDPEIPCVSCIHAGADLEENAEPHPARKGYPFPWSRDFKDCLGQAEPDECTGTYACCAGCPRFRDWG